MLRIAPDQDPQGPPTGPPPDAGAPPDAPPPDPTQPPPDPSQDPSQSPQMMNHKIPPMIASYMGPEMGPFQCGNCHFFEAPNSCSVVDGPINPGGCCNNFTPGGAGPAGPPQVGQDQPDPTQAPDQAPPDAPPPDQNKEA